MKLALYNSKTKTAVGMILSAFLVNSMLVGCAGGAADVTTLGKASMTIIWPARTRDIPAAANSINLTLTANSTVVATQTVARPTSGNQTTVNFSNLAAGEMMLKAQAFPNADGSGVAQGSASQGVTITAGTVTPVTLTMASTITSVTATPTAPTVLIGTSVTLVPTAHDVNNSTVITSAFTYSSSNTSVASVDTLGSVTGLTAGTSTITITETESGMTGTVLVTVN